MLIRPYGTMRDVIGILNNVATQAAIVVDDADRLCGMVTDGDVRRAVLNGSSLDTPVKNFMNDTPASLPHTASEAQALQSMRKLYVRHMPLVDEEGRVVRVAFLDDVAGYALPNAVVLMAGGLGSRLGELTKNCPKPLLPVGNKPIAETVIETFASQGFHHIHISVNYHADKIIEYFGDGSRYGVEIVYLREQKRMGTVGALSLLSEAPPHPLIVMNADILTRINFRNMLEYHHVSGSAATMAVKEFQQQIPYGVVQMDDRLLITDIVEKPVSTFFISAGIYVLSPSCLNFIPKNTFYDMPTLFEELRSAGMHTCGYPLSEYWLDIGKAEDYERANADYEQLF